MRKDSQIELIAKADGTIPVKDEEEYESSLDVNYDAILAEFRDEEAKSCFRNRLPIILLGVLFFLFLLLSVLLVGSIGADSEAEY